MKAIGTIYKGVKFRSRLEARWAVFFDEYGLKWEYEPETFEISLWDSVKEERYKDWYCPDFYLPELEMYIEIKPDKEGNDWNKYNAFRSLIAMVIGLPALNVWWLKNDGDPWIGYPFKNDNGEWKFGTVQYYPDVDLRDSLNTHPAAKTAREYDFFKF